MTDDEVISYLSGLRVAKLVKDGIYNVYGVPHTTGDFHAHLRLLKKGEPVFIEADGTPVLQLVCGNPLILGPKKPGVANPVVTTTGPVSPGHGIEVGAPPVESPAQPAPGAPEVGPVPEAHNPPATPVVPMLLGLAGSIGFFIHNGHHPVPEPMSLLVIGSGVAAIAARRRAKKA